MKQGRLANHPGSPALEVPPRDRRDAALDKAEAALAELLAVVDQVDDGEGCEFARAARRLADVAEVRHESAKREARRAIADIQTLRGRG